MKAVILALTFGRAAQDDCVPFIKTINLVVLQHFVRFTPISHRNPFKTVFCEREPYLLTLST